MTKKFSIFLTIIIPLISIAQSKENITVEQIFKNKYSHGLISKGDNFPDFYPETDSITHFLVALHHDIDVDEFITKTSYSANGIRNLEALLIEKNWAHLVDGELKPSIFIASKEDGRKLYEEAYKASMDITNEIRKLLPFILGKFKETSISKTDDFDKWSFLILSNVLLDSWMIDYVEKDYLKKENRPNRHGKNYYYSIRQVTSNTEAFGIYGNMYKMENGVSISVYGNNRMVKGPPEIKNSISKLDNQKLDEMVDAFRPILLSVLLKNDHHFKKVYNSLGYSKEISYEEFFIWFYHFIYTKATNIMSEEGLLQIPPSGNFYYSLEE